jgi:hypothetical protein
VFAVLSLSPLVSDHEHLKIRFQSKILIRISYNDGMYIMSNVPLLQCLLTTLIKNPQTQVKENKPIAMSKKKQTKKKNRTNVSSKLVGYQSMYPSVSSCNYHDHIIIKPRILGGLLKNRCQQFLSNEYPAWTLHKKLGEEHVHVHRQLKHMHIHSCLP